MAENADGWCGRVARMDATTAAAPTFDLDTFLALPRVAGLALSPAGDRLAVAVATLDDAGTRYGTAIWAVDTEGRSPARRLTRSVKGESAPTFTPDGALLFASARPTPDGEGDDAPRLWVLPADGGEAYAIAAPPAGVDAILVARGSGTVVLRAALHPAAEDFESDADVEKARTEAKVTAQLIEHFPARFWDRWLGPRQSRLLAAPAPAEDATWRDVTDDPGFRHEDQGADISADGRLVAASRWHDVPDPRDRGVDLLAIELDAEAAPIGERVLASEPRVMYGDAAIAPEGTRVACVRHPVGSPDGPPDHTLVVIDVASGEQTDVLEGFDRWPGSPVWTPDGGALLFLADDDGRTLPFRVDLGDGTVTRLAVEGAWSDLLVAPDGATLYAIRSDVGAPHHVVALDLDVDGAVPRVLHAPAGDAGPLGRVERVEATAEDGVRIPGWLVLPEAAGASSPAPLVVFIHGGPLGSWAGWHWRWNPHVLAAEGFAVLCPDPALSTGYGVDFIARGWGRWGAEPYTDILTLTDAVEARDDVDPERTAAMGGSFGGYMANWIAGHTDRFDAIVTHASLWNLEAFHGTTDLGPWWENEFGDRYRAPERYREWSPHRFVGDITTPMLVIHGERDFRVPVSEGLSLWTDLQRHAVEGAYLHFPDEHHWITKPPHIRVWYATVLAFLRHRVLGEEWVRPPLL
jgi:dipeptidyl aminopeptidase/acylaminoacyl peptidase